MTQHRWTIGLILTLLFALAPGQAGAQATVSGVTLLPSSPTNLDILQITLNGNGCVGFSQPPEVSAFVISIDATQSPCPPGPPPPVWSQQFVVGPLAAGTYTLTVYLGQSVGWCLGS